MNFKYSDDKKYLADILCNGDIKKLKKNFKDYFDFRSPSAKRAEFNSKRKALFPIVFERTKGMCQICKKTKGVEIDHIISLKSNLLNKKFRGMTSKIISGRLKKVPAESYGSNNLKNLQLVCKKCNRDKGWIF